MRIFLCFSLILLWSSHNAQGLYDTDNVTTIEITFQDNDWHQTLNNFYAAGSGQRLIATVEINGVAFDSVGVRYRGGSTYNPANDKNPLNIKLDHLKLQDYQGFEVIKLSNGAKDPSWLREVLGFEIARYVMEAPKANYASVYVNGNFHGVYANVESINSNFVKDRFLSNSNNTRFEANPNYDFDQIPSPPFGCTEGHGAALEYLGPSDVCYFDHYELQSAIGWNELRALTDLLQNNPNNIRSLLDLDRFIWMSAFNNLIVNFDSYLGASPRNYVIFKADNGHWAPVVDDLNEAFARFPWLTIPLPNDPQPSLGFYTDLPLFQGENDPQKPLLNALFSTNTGRNMYVAHVRTMINDLFLSGWFEGRVIDLQGLISDEVLSDDKHFYSHDDFLDNYDQTVVDVYNGEDAYGLYPLMDGRIAYLLDQPALQATPPAISDVTASPDMPAPGNDVDITAMVSNADNVWLGVRNNRSEVFQLVSMFDDGNHGDGAAGDGIYGASVTIEIGGMQYYIYAENDEAGMFSPERAEYVFYELSAVGSVVINELMASNMTSVPDQNDQYDDWAELYNGSQDAIDLSGWYLSDDLQNVTKYQFPPGVVINPGGYLTIWVDSDPNQPGLHTPFKLSAGGEALILSRPDLTVVDQVVFGVQTTDVAYGRCPNGWGPFTFLSHTFGADNTSACTTPTNEANTRIGLKVYPNPAQSQLTVETNLMYETKGILWSTFGQKVAKFQFTGKGTIDVSGLTAGVYFLEVEGGAREKIIITTSTR